MSVVESDSEELIDLKRPFSSARVTEPLRRVGSGTLGACCHPELLACEDDTLLGWWNAIPVPNLRLEVLNHVCHSTSGPD